MVNFTTQSSSGLQHISLLRKAISQKMTGTMHFHFENSDPVEIDFFKGDMIGISALKGGESPIVENLRKVILHPVTQFAWEEKRHEAKFGWMSPAIALSKAITDLPLSFDRVKTYKDSFSKLPPLTLKAKPIHRYSFGDETEYQYLYQLSLKAPSFKLGDFFGKYTSDEDFLKKVRTILFAFLLGYLVPAAGGVSKESGRAGVAARIMQRFRRG